jgi:membrane protease YdiL (CAAX protease family)
MVWGITGASRYALAPAYNLAIEVGIMALNLTLPLAAIAWRPLGNTPRDFLGWRGKPGRIAAWAMGGAVAMAVLLIGSQLLFGSPFGPGEGGALSRTLAAFAIAELLLLNGFAEETMFRGYLQGVFTQWKGAAVGILLSTLLFGIRHLPMDLHHAMEQHAGLSGWAARLLQLYGAGFILSLLRHFARSTWASWIVHELMLLLVVLVGVLPRMQ